MAPVVIPHWLDYENGGKNLDLGSFREKVSSYPINGSEFSPEMTCIINIGRCGDFSVLSALTSSLQFTVTPTQDCHLAGNAYCFIKKMETWFGSSQLESCDNYYSLCVAVFDSTVDKSARSTQYSITHGSTDTFAGEKLDQDTPRTYSIPILGSAILGTGSRHMCPLYALRNGNLQLRITFNTAAAAVKSTAGNAANLKFSSISYDGDVVFLNQRVIDQITSDPIVLHAESYSNLQYTLPANSPSFQQTLTANYASLKSVYFMFRDTAAITEIDKYSNGRSALKDLDSYCFQYGSKILPASWVKCKSTGGVEPFRALSDSFHAGSGFSNVCMGSHTFASYNIEVESGTTPAGSCLYGQDFETFVGKDSLIQGISTKNESLVLRGVISGTPSDKTFQWDVYMHYDVTLVFENQGVVLLH